MTTANPYVDDPITAEIFELGYVAGFQDPGGSDFLPLSPELLDIYQQGIDSGRDDAAQSPTAWVPRSELEGESSDEREEHLIIEGVARGRRTPLPTGRVRTDRRPRHGWASRSDRRPVQPHRQQLRAGMGGSRSVSRRSGPRAPGSIDRFH